MGQQAIELSEEIERLMFVAKNLKTTAPDGDKARLMAIVMTHLETAKLFAKDAGN